MAVKYHLGKFPPKESDWAKLIPLIGPASAGLARYEGLLSAIPNVHVLLSPLTTQEAVLSSKIEGTHVTMGEVLEIEAGGQPDLFSQTKRDDAEEVLNYRSAMRACVSEMGQRPFSQQILRAAHGMLMKGVRGRDKNPGSYRTEPNWIGRKGCTIKEASFVPIGVEHLQTGMDDWEKYFGSTTNRTRSPSSPFSMWNLRRCIRSRMAMAVWEECCCRCFCSNGNCFPVPIST